MLPRSSKANSTSPVPRRCLFFPAESSDKTFDATTSACCMAAWAVRGTAGTAAGTISEQSPRAHTGGADDDDDEASSAHRRVGSTFSRPEDERARPPPKLAFPTGYAGPLPAVHSTASKASSSSSSSSPPEDEELDRRRKRDRPSDPPPAEISSTMPPVVSHRTPSFARACSTSGSARVPSMGAPLLTSVTRAAGSLRATQAASSTPPYPPPTTAIRGFSPLRDRSSISNSSSRVA
mmetsp:Transcript_21177/g.50265  ORF Transcript_21177/g.50265 Transcript_21177/m.50265 type:complete len:236 (+) Transcript_21177:482-1189(+)